MTLILNGQKNAVRIDEMRDNSRKNFISFYIERKVKMGNIKIYAFADEADSNIDGQIKAMKRNELDGLEIRGVDGENISDITLEKANEVKSKLEANGLIIWSIGSPIGKININEDFEPHIEKYKHTLDVAAVLGAENIRMFSFYIPKEIKPADCKEEVIERIGKFVEIAKGTGINLCHENEKGIYGDIPERCLEIHKAIPELKGIFDPANYVQCGIDTLKGWELLKDYIYYMHIKDSKSDGFVVPAGMGDGNVSAIVKDFIARGGNSFTIEPHLTVFKGLEGLEQKGEETKMAFKYLDNNSAFDAACDAFKKII